MRVAAFYKKAKVDNRIGPIHIALYFAMLQDAASCGIDVVIPVREHLMALAKIASTVTYHRGLRELHEYGYILYRPSFAAGRTRVVMIELD